MPINLLKSPIPQLFIEYATNAGQHKNGEGSGKVIRNPYPGPDRHQTLITSSDL